MNECLTCKKQFAVPSYRREKAKFCSYSCYWGYSKTLIAPERIECKHCNQFKNKRFFNKSRTGKFGLKSYCSSCSKNYYQEWLNKNYDKKQQYSRNYFHSLEKTPETLFKTLKHNAKSKGREFTISLELFEEMMNKPCHYCGTMDINTAGLDRVDSDKGYILGNIVRACRICNVAKGQLTPQEFIQHCKNVVKHNGDK